MRWRDSYVTIIRAKTITLEQRPRFIFLGLLTCSYRRGIFLVDGSGKEGTVSTASRNCRNHGQRLRALGFNAPQVPGSQRLVPWILRSTRLKWLNNPSGKPQTPCDLGLCKCKPKAKTAAFQGRALSHTILPTTLSSICRLEAGAGTSPPPSSSSQPRAPP
jgi:hypothetical protein